MTKQQKFKVKIPKGYTANERKVIAQEIIDFVVDRTQGGKDKDNKKFKGYSKGYTNSLDFKIAGKSPGKVDLTLTEEMLNELKMVSQKDGQLEIGYDARRTKLNGKVEGNVKGTYGQKYKRISKRKPRDFMGITQKDLDKILGRFPLDDRTTRLAEILLAQRSRERAQEIINETEFDDEPESE
jgi:hypothetical protein